MEPPKDETVLAGIVTFNPDIERLRENVQAVSVQVEKIIIFDNASANVDDVCDVAREFGNADVIRSPRNIGIAAALNGIVDTASAHGCSWVLTLDQDSVCAADMVEKLRANADQSRPLVTPYIIDRNKMKLDEYLKLDLPPFQLFRRAASKGAITSGALVNTRVFDEVGSFDEKFFIDLVDYDFNMRLLQAGYPIVRVNGTYLVHEHGEARRTWLVTPRKSLDGRWYLERFYSFNHTSMRCYYKARNRVLYSKKYWRVIGLSNEGIAQIPQVIALTLLFEGDRMSKLRAFVRGIVDGIRTPVDSSPVIATGRRVDSV
ncbi:MULTISPECIES: glycosyltransferase [Mycobacteriaceae]|uniref:glycosyltransferase n=1 Tax=Mycobacteriaceae TaxID=1762 RepID=UPI000B2CE2D5|nr:MULTISPECIES: glycosyltransferase [Mycobacteriaceae]